MEYIPEVVIAGAVIWSVVEGLKKAFPKFFKREFPTRVIPIGVLVLGGVLFALWPRIEMPLFDKVFLGIIAGSFSSQIHNVLAKSIVKEAAR